MNKKYIEENSDFFNKYINNFNLLIVTATRIEKETLHNYLKPISGKGGLIKISIGKQTYYLGIFGTYNAIHVACGDMGSIGRESSIITTTDAIGACKPKIVLMVGIAFGIDKKKQKIGDVLISERIIPYEPQRVGTKETINRGKEGPASSLLLNRFRNIDDWKYEIRNKEANIIIGQILSGEKLIDNPDLIKTLSHTYPNAKGGEMEGAGIYAACDGKVSHWILVKGICDYADGNKKRNKTTNQKIASEAAINLCEHVFNSSHPFEDIEVFPENVGVYSKVISVSDKLSTVNVSDFLNKQVNRQLKKQINSGKYLQNTFIETGDQKDHLRYLSDPIFYSEKCFQEIQIMDFRYLNDFLKKNQLPEFALDFEKFKVNKGVEDVYNVHQIINEWYGYLINKKQEVVDIKISSNEKSKFEYKFNDRIEDLSFLKSRVALVTETAGQGKTNFICDFTENFLLKRKIPTVFLTGSEVNALNIRQSLIKKIFPDSDDLSFEELLISLNKICYEQNKFFVLIIDGLNENANPKTFSQNIESFISELLEHEFVRIIVTCRTEYYLNNFSNLEKSSFAEEVIKIASLVSHHPDDDLKDKLFTIYFDHFNIGYRYISNKAYDQLVSSFLLLRIFCEAYRGDNIDYIDNIYKEELFEKYYSIKSEEINKRLNQNDELNIKGTLDIQKFITNILEFMIQNRVYVNVPFEKIIEDGKHRELYIRFIDENILVRRDIQTEPAGIFSSSEVVNFTFDEFRDFLISRYLIQILYKESQSSFESFIQSEITDKSPLLEGCSTFLFFISRKLNDDGLNKIIKRQSWFESIFSKCIFQLKDSQVTEEDKEILEKNLKNDLLSSSSILVDLIGRYDTDYYKNLNIDFLFRTLRNFNQNEYEKHFINLFNGKYWDHSKIDQEKLVEQIIVIFDEEDFDVKPSLTNSSSTSFVIISDGEFNFHDFIKAIGINKDSQFIDIYKSLFDSFKDDMQPARQYYRKHFQDKYSTFEEFISEHLWKSGKDVLPKILEAEKVGKNVYIGELSSDTNETECFFCTDEFIIESEKLYVDAQENGW